ncbi:MAG: GNAT family N-acetyltransferase [Opitutales bacterium]
MPDASPDAPAAVRMICRDLSAAPIFRLPEGFRIANFAVGDADTWLAVQKAAEPRLPVELPWFFSDFGEDPKVHADRILFLSTAGGEPIGTATAWFDDVEKRPERGRLHWVAIVPDHQGRGLAKPLVSAALQRLQQLGHREAFLHTDEGRPLAIRLYEQFGFARFV